LGGSKGGGGVNTVFLWVSPVGVMPRDGD
jgi:hypothetical protein